MTTKELVVGTAHWYRVAEHDSLPVIASMKWNTPFSQPVPPQMTVLGALSKQIVGPGRAEEECASPAQTLMVYAPFLFTAVWEALWTRLVLEVLRLPKLAVWNVIFSLVGSVSSRPCSSTLTPFRTAGSWPTCFRSLSGATTLNSARIRPENRIPSQRLQHDLGEDVRVHIGVSEVDHAELDGGLEDVGQQLAKGVDSVQIQRGAGGGIEVEQSDCGLGCGLADHRRARSDAERGKIG